MMNSAAAHAVTLVDPAPGDLVLPMDRVRAGIAREDLPRFGDLYWEISLLNHSESSDTLHQDWRKTPATFRPPLMRAGWAVLNIPTPEALRNTRVVSTALVSAGTAGKIFYGWRIFAEWLVAQGINSLDLVTVDDLTAYAAYQRSIRSWEESRRQLANITRLWAYAPFLLRSDRIPRPPWEAANGAMLTDFLGERDDADSENDTAPVHPAVMSPLLLWCLRMVTDLSGDILAAQRERERVMSRIPDRESSLWGESNRVIAHLRGLRDNGQPIPTYAGHTAGTIANQFLPSDTRTHSRVTSLELLAGTLGVTKNQVTRAMKILRGELEDRHFGDGAPLDLPIAGRIGDTPWTPNIDLSDVVDLVLHLSTAALVVITYLSGVRPIEALHLERGCCFQEERDDGTVRYKMRGRYFKNAKDENGHLIPGGLLREDPWTVIEIVQRAIAILEALHGDRLLFPRTLSRFPKPSSGRRHAMTAPMSVKRIAHLIDWANGIAAAHGRTHEMIPQDPDGSVTLSRFRRTVAWFIRRQPDGDIGLAVQYGHLETIMGESYAGRSKTDMLEILDFERGLAMADTLAEASDWINAGQGVSGPAAGRYISAATEFGNKYAGGFITTRQLNALRENPKLQVYSSPQAFMTCNNDPFKALCDSELAITGRPSLRTPSFSRCDPRCPNLSRDDTDIDNARKEFDEIEAEIEAGINPWPLEQRQRQRQTTLVQIISKHEATRIHRIDAKEST